MSIVSSALTDETRDGFIYRARVYTIATGRVVIEKVQFGVPWPTPWMSRSCSPTSRACPPTEPEKRPDRQSDWKQNPTRDVEQPGSSHGSIPVRSLVQLQPSQPF